MIPFSFKKYLSYILFAKDAHHLHSPFLFELYTDVILNKENFYAYEKLFSIRGKLKNDTTEISHLDFGAGSLINPNGRKSIAQIAARGLTKEKYARLLFRLVEFFQCNYMVELGTSLGLTSLYLATANSGSKLFTFEGCPELTLFAKNLAASNGIRNIQFHQGNFDETFIKFLDDSEKIDFIFFDGNHRKEPTLRYFEAALRKKHNYSVFVFDDIYWSAEMEEAWREIKMHPEVTVSIDLFQFGLVLFRKENKIKEDVVLRF